ncbi:VOC family protein [Massilia sp. TS11]|uniref:VOC family protein n=1 Tax=Massilia sp. TS11 TaxID=2908003 RepID=UPI001EDB87FF|nr:VOC family protein [Massilia sp. TS11]MCG2585263.1 VOC family protein [Massilia sp. TS11]
MRIEHVALWARDLEAMKAFYVQAFGAAAGERYTNPAHGFASYFLRFDSGARLELMQMPGIAPNPNTAQAQALGFVHIAVATGSQQAVDATTARLVAGGAVLQSPAHWTGDGYYESVLLDPEGNRVEITI